MSKGRDLAIDNIRRLREGGYSAYLAGGCVRDELMGIEPKDYDIATSARPEEVMKVFPKVIPLGLKYGVVLVIREKLSFEVTTFRSDTQYIDGRHPKEVHFSSAKEDALRRDFTINGLFYDPIKGEIIDYVGGRVDIEKKVIRTVGAPRERFDEDRLRMMRAVRFAARFGFKIEENTYQAIKELAWKVKGVSGERVGEELTKIVTGNSPGLGVGLLHDLGIMEVILPEVSRMVGIRQPEEFHPEGDVFTHTRLMLDLLRAPSDVLAFAALLHDIGKPLAFHVAERIRFNSHDRIGAEITDKVCRRLKFSKEKRERIVACVENHMRMADAQKMREGKLKRLLQRETFLEELELHRLDCTASHRNLDNWKFLRRKLKEYSKEEVHPQPLLRGRDLIKAGYKPGPKFKLMLKAVEEAQLERRIRTKEEALMFIKKIFG